MKTRVFDLGFSMARLEEDDEGNPMLTIMQPATEADAAASMVIAGKDNLQSLASHIFDTLES